MIDEGCANGSPEPRVINNWKKEMGMIKCITCNSSMIEWLQDGSKEKRWNAQQTKAMEREVHGVWAADDSRKNEVSNKKWWNDPRMKRNSFKAFWSCNKRLLQGKMNKRSQSHKMIQRSSVINGSDEVHVHNGTITWLVNMAICIALGPRFCAIL